MVWLERIGVKFVGHGLSKDFRVINMLPRPEQILDTVNLFYLQCGVFSLTDRPWLGSMLNLGTQEQPQDLA